MTGLSTDLEIYLPVENDLLTVTVNVTVDFTSPVTFGRDFGRAPISWCYSVKQVNALNGGQLTGVDPKYKQDLDREIYYKIQKLQWIK